MGTHCVVRRFIDLLLRAHSVPDGCSVGNGREYGARLFCAYYGGLHRMAAPESAAGDANETERLGTGAGYLGCAAGNCRDTWGGVVYGTAGVRDRTGGGSPLSGGYALDEDSGVPAGAAPFYDSDSGDHLCGADVTAARACEPVGRSDDQLD